MTSELLDSTLSIGIELSIGIDPSIGIELSIGMECSPMIIGWLPSSNIGEDSIKGAAMCMPLSMTVAVESPQHEAATGIAEQVVLGQASTLEQGLC